MGFFWNWVGKKLRLPELERRVDAMEGVIEATLAQFGDYKNRTRQQLRQMQKDIDNLLDTVEALIQAAEHQEDIQRAKQLRTKLRNNRTRIVNTLAAA